MPTSEILCAKCGYALMTDVQIPSFPVPDLIHKPRVPSQSETVLIRSILSAVHTNISRLDDEIRQLEETKQELLRLRGALFEYTKDNEAVLTPIERLPPELL
jgi:hypothetical protein